MGAASHVQGASLGLDRVGIGYTLATGRLFCTLASFQEFAEQLLARPVLTHEFADAALWDEMRERYEALATELREG
jgi:hypothetical protein